ncbi:MAG: hypothetical protein KGD64_14945 [Candidatus Heimdallarchaeota archaeon]|nr:hypothetical protein [Candidatus Heimdallarchaeota archaeon]
MVWKMVFKIYAENTEKMLELARYKLKDMKNVKYFLTKFFEEQKDWIKDEQKLGKGLGYEVVLVDESGNDLPLKNLYEILHSKEDILSIFSMTTDAIGELLAEEAS